MKPLCASCSAAERPRLAASSAAAAHPPSPPAGAAPFRGSLTRMTRRRKAVLLGVAVTLAAALATVMLGVASGEGPAGSTAARTISVGGVGTVAIGIKDTASEATAVYREGMAKALLDAQTKASFLAEKSGGAVGAAISVIENGGSIECTGAYEEEGSAAYARYEGEQPDFGWGHEPGVVPGSSGAAAPTSAVAPEKAVSHRPKAKKRKRRHTAKKAATSTAKCNLTAEVAAVYAAG
jgi:hypothetical protein